jgi:hypothetical protein
MAKEVDDFTNSDGGELWKKNKTIEQNRIEDCPVCYATGKVHADEHIEYPCDLCDSTGKLTESQLRICKRDGYDDTGDGK